ncbi:disulfide bond formation protein B [Roseicyclus mahoneyensis]|uniref:Disulfide bond formation protein DsbB n=1 Tax=Roseicyclus mahoneyensis TaxID=164332 RepID=A0A316GT04_9RHOB|nr:disulfide bond formation protein B [Roseicyclus mahoneyensis]PWK62726.1 disulfide bond formation protein DsbB [Roseicyclus mahoneyensis]
MQRTHLIALAALGSLGLLAGAFAFQYIGGLAPCAMCLWQRWPHAAAIVIGGVGLALPHALVALAGAAAMLTGAGIALMHTGVERGWWTLNLSCTGGGEDLRAMDISALLDPTQGGAVVMCTDVPWSMLGLSMASWNGIASLVLVAFWLAAARARAAQGLRPSGR